MGEIRITLETLYDILRNEKKREDLQKLEATFFLDVITHLREKQTLLESIKDDTQIFAVSEKQKVEYELRSTRRILKEIYEKREKKIIEIALNKSRTGSDIIDTSAMLSEELDFYHKILMTLDAHRHGVLLNLMQGQLPMLSVPSISMQSSLLEQKKEQIRKELEQAMPDADEDAPENPDKTRIKFTHAVPSFVWKDMKVYGPFDTGEETEIFPEVADLLVRKGRAVKV
ncbi:hypothetical protein HYX14_00900 [Candidatus Woesearchaeota archaeon]|nr:hypothetical protein [Candidatus Woesearchaeota archaeon]